MKYSDYKRLGKISIKSRRKSTRNTVRGIGFGLIIIVPIVFFALAFYLDLTKKINTLLSVSSFQIVTTHPDLNLNNNYENNNKIPYESLEDIVNIKGVETHQLSQYFNISLKPGLNNRMTYYVYQGHTVSMQASDISYLNNKYKVCYNNQNSELISAAERKDLLSLTGNDSPYLYGKGFYGDRKQQVIISEQFLNQVFGYINMNFIGEQLSMFYVVNKDDRYIIDDNNNPNDIPDLNYQPEILTAINIFKNYEIVGVLKKELYNLPSRENESHIWFNSASLYNENNVSSLPIHSQYVEEEKVANVYTYPREIISYSEEITNNGYMFIPIGLGAEYIYGPSPTLQVKLQCKNYQSATTVEKELYEVYNEYLLSKDSFTTNSIYRHLQMINVTGGYVILALFIFASIILFATLLNLYNSINYSVEIRKNYIGVMRAIGAKEKVIPRLYFVEIMIIFMKTFVWVIVFGGMLSYIIKLLIDASFRTFKDILPFTIRLNLNYYLLALLIMIVFEFLIAFIYSQIACRKVSHKPILEILKDEK